MTIGIALSGPGAGRAALAALAAVERTGRGAIGGFVSLVALDADGGLAEAATQRGGTATLFEGPVPDRIATAPRVALMSSGPDRPEPLSQFTPADPQAGLVSGHRLPNVARPGLRAPNREALDRLRAGEGVQAAVRAPLEADPAADAGLIALDLAGNLAFANSAAVARRDDTGEALVEDAATGLRIAVLHNSIFPHRCIAGVAVAAALDAADPGDRTDRETSILGTPVHLGPVHALDLSADGLSARIAVPERHWLGPEWEGSAVRRGDPVLQDGRVVGRVTREVYCVLRDGVVQAGRGGECVGWVRTGEPRP